MRTNGKISRKKEKKKPQKNPASHRLLWRERKALGRFPREGDFG